jgi:hypothetical protein
MRHTTVEGPASAPVGGTDNIAESADSTRVERPPTARWVGVVVYARARVRGVNREFQA